MTRGRVVRGEEAARGAPFLAPGVGGVQARRIAREELQARTTADRIVATAREQAEAIVAAARTQAAATSAEATREAREAADAQLLARWVALRDEEARRAGSDEDRLLKIAVVLAERIVGAVLDAEPSRMGALTAGVLAEARGVRRAVIEASAQDAEEVRRYLSAAGMEPASFEVKVDDTLGRGALRLYTDVGVIEAQLGARLERLAAVLRDVIRK